MQPYGFPELPFWFFNNSKVTRKHIGIRGMIDSLTIWRKCFLSPRNYSEFFGANCDILTF